MHHFTISTCETVPQFNDNLMTQVAEGKGCWELEQLKHLSLKIKEATSKNVVITEKKVRKLCQTKSYILTKGMYL